ncbi:hypothetical protein [Tamlana sp. I1]|uniref:hypothetical protein n=1 Tax=Tamlana sp. I1 TaxID=2762061 RepID=UPI00188E68F3|nr:hypothetical protein [Tamlana sp. I1]
MKDHKNRPDFNHLQDIKIDYTKQRKLVYSSFYAAPRTMLMVALDAGVFRANVCRYVAQFKNQNAIAEVKKGICEISKHPATYYSTNPKYFEDDDESLKEAANE